MRILSSRAILMASCLSLSLCLGANARNTSSAINLQPESFNLANVEEPLNLKTPASEVLVADRRYRRRRVSRRRDCDRPNYRVTDRNRYGRRDSYRDYPVNRRDRYRDYPVTRRDRYRDYPVNRRDRYRDYQVIRRDYPEDYREIRRDRRRDYREARRDYKQDLRQVHRDYREARRDYYEDLREIKR